MTLSHIPSTMTNDECFRLTGALPTDRIVQLLDEADRFREAALQVQERLADIPEPKKPNAAQAALQKNLEAIAGALAEWLPE
jgi:hypothetical protein